MQEIKYLPIEGIKVNPNNPRIIKDEKFKALCESIKKNPDYFETRPILVNKEMIIFAGNMRYLAAKSIGLKEVPVAIFDISQERERELLLRDNFSNGEWNLDELVNFSEELLKDIGWSSEELDNIFLGEIHHEQFNLEEELRKININEITTQKGDVWQLGENRLMCGDSTIEEDILKLMNGEKADMCFTDPPYILDYLGGKRRGNPTEGFGAKKNRRYLETDVLPSNFTELWMANINKIQKDNFHIICYENWKNILTIWNEMLKYWKVKNLIVWHTLNRMQGFSAKYRFFSKHDIAMVGTTEENTNLNLEPEEEILQNEYETALYASSGKPHWEGYGKGNKYCPTDFVEVVGDEKSTGQGLVFGTKPLEILIPYIKVLTKRGDLIVEPFGGSGSTLIAAEKMKRKCYIMEKSPIYTEVIRNRWEKTTNQKAMKI